MNTDNNFQWTDEFVREIVGIAHKDGYESIQKTDLDKLVDRFKQSKLEEQQQIPNNEWEVVELIFWSGEKTTDFLVIQNWLRGDKRYEKWSIYSVKRLSDGEVFTIGAKLEWGGGSISPKSRLQLMAGPIISFSIREDNMVYAEVSDKIFFPITHLHKAKPKPQPSSIDRIEVLKIGNRVDIKTPEWPQAYYLQFCTNKQIWEDKFPAIKQAIEQAINNKEEKCLFNVDAINKRLDELKDSKWVKSKGAGTLRFVTRKVSDKIFEDDGLISGQPPSKSCHYDKYEDLTKEEEVAAWCGYMARQPLQFYSPDKKYSQSEVDTIREETWNESRKLTTGTSITGFLGTGLKYPTLQDYLNSLSKETKPKEEDKPVIIENKDRCGICGGEMVYIRGRYPNTDKRKVCPTCTTERLEQISEISSKNYGKACQSN